MKKIQSLGISSFPPIQSQRWNSVFHTLNYIINNIGSICHLFTLNELAYLQMIELLNLSYLLLPIHIFTTICEANESTQARAYTAYRGMKASLRLNPSKRAQKLLRIIKKRFHSTADIKIAKLCYFTTNMGISEKQERYPHVSSECVQDKNDENATKFNNELKFLKSFIPTIQKICKIMNLNFENVFNGFEILMKYYNPSNKDIDKYPTSIQLHDLFLEITGDDRSYIYLSHFLDILQVLPASEAAAERIFARMRDLYNVRQTNLSGNSLKNNLIVSFEAQKIRESESEAEI